MENYKRKELWLSKDIGTWGGTKFHYFRVKFGQIFPDTEYHYDDGYPYGTVKPIKEMNQELHDLLHKELVTNN